MTYFTLSGGRTPHNVLCTSGLSRTLSVRSSGLSRVLRLSWAAAFLLAAVLIVPFAGLANAAVAPPLDVPADHPRIYFTSEDVARFRIQLNNSYTARNNNIRENSFQYLITGSATAANKAIAAAVALCRSNLGSNPNEDFEDIFSIAICYDWCFPVLGASKAQLQTTLGDAMDKNRFVANMDRGAGHNMSTENSLGALSAGLALYGENANAETWLRAARRVVVDQCMTGYLDKICPDGDDMEGTQYHGARYQGEGIWAWIWLKGTGENLFTEDHPHLMNGVNWWIYMLEPHMSKTHIVCGDTNNRGISARNVTSAACLAMGAGDPYAAWYASYGGLSGWEAVALKAPVSKAPSEGMPLHKFFRDNMAIIRSGWNIGTSSRDTVFTFVCRDYMQGWHCHQDVNHFIVSRRGELAIDSGKYDSNNEHSRSYNRRTIAHNSMLVYDPLEPLPSLTDARDGGQVFHNDSTFLNRTGATLYNWRTYDNADFRSFAAYRDFYYMCGDGTKAYNYKDFKKVESFTREVVYVSEVDPPVIVIFDRVDATKSSSKKTWLLHTIQQPTVAGNSVTVLESNGQLTVQSLLPKNPAISLVGGPNKQYWVEDPGKNYVPGGTSGTADQGWRGNWRVEISPTAQAANDLFLTILYPCDPGADAPVSTLLEPDGQACCEVTVAGKTFTILFNTQGDTGGTFNDIPFPPPPARAGDASFLY